MDVYLSSTPGGVLKLVSSESFPLMGSCRKEIVSHFSQPVLLPYFLLHPRDLFEFPNTLQRDSLKSGFSKNFFFSPLQNSQPFSFSPWETYLKFPHTSDGDSPQVWTMVVDKVYFLSNIKKIYIFGGKKIMISLIWDCQKLWHNTFITASYVTKGFKTTRFQ